MLRKPLNRLERDLRSDYLAPGDELALMQAAEQVAEALRVGICPEDRAFDRFLSHELQIISGQYWTPLAVALRAAAWFYELDVRTVADIGSGAGKFCVAAALAGRCYFTGLEQRPRLVTAARTLARFFKVDNRVCFVEGTLGDIAPPIADAYYLFNPFGENLFNQDDCIDDSVELSNERYVRDIAAMEDLLHRASVGTYVLTYNGFGGRVPYSYDEVRVARDLPKLLRMWRKTRSKQPTLASGRTIKDRPTEPVSLT